MNSSNLCSDTCPFRFYPSFQSFSCQPCPYDCLTCNYKGECLNCSLDDFRVLFTNLSRCLAMAGYYDNKTTISVKCPKGCYLCQSEQFCINCLPGYYLNLNFLCAVDCPPTFYRDNTTRVCRSCPYDCEQCDTNGKCFGCNEIVDFRVLSNSSYRCVPKRGYFDNNARTAANCPAGCSAC